MPTVAPMNAETVAKALGGCRAGVTWMARCPVHEDRHASLAIKDSQDGKLLVRCHAGCEQRDVIATLKSRGLWEMKGISQTVHRKQHVIVSNDDAVKRAASGMAIWDASRAPEKTVVATYLKTRGLILPKEVPLRFHSELRHPTGNSWPAMVALVTDAIANRPLGIHRTYLERTGNGKAPVKPSRMMLGPCHGGAVRLGPLTSPLMIGEGIETCLSAAQASGHSAWAALSTSGLRSLELPAEVTHVIILADGDAPGEAAANIAATRWERQGRRVQIARPPPNCDFNDLLLAEIGAGGSS